MKWLNWSYLRFGLLALTQSALITILLHPWLQLAAPYWQFPLAIGTLWILVTTLLSIAIVKKAMGKGKQGLPFVIGGILAPIAVAIILGLHILFFIPLTLFLFYVGVRFCDYPKRTRFTFDWALGSMILIISSAFDGLLGYEVTLASVLLFFALGIGSMIMWNATVLEEDGLQPDYQGLGRSIGTFIIVVGMVSLALGMLLSPSFLQGFVGVIYRIYLIVADGVVLFVVRPFVWLLGPLFRLVENLELQERHIELPANERVEDEQLQRMDSDLSPEAMEAITWIGWAIFIAIFLMVLWLIVRCLLRRPHGEGSDLMKETRESVFSGAELLRDLKTAFKGMLQPLAGLRQLKWYKGDDPLLIIRTIYIRFVLKARKRVPIFTSDTPNDYARSLKDEEEEVNREALHTLTTLYNDARYGEVGDHDAVSSAEKAFRGI